MANKQLLVARLIEKGVTRGEAAEKLGISRTAFENKLNGLTEFKATEIVTLSALLGIRRQKDKYFFAENVPNESTNNE